LTATAVQRAGVPVLDSAGPAMCCNSWRAGGGAVRARTGSSGEASVLAWRGRRRRAVSASRPRVSPLAMSCDPCRWQSPAADHQRDARPQWPWRWAEDRADQRTRVMPPPLPPPSLAAGPARLPGPLIHDPDRPAGTGGDRRPHRSPPLPALRTETEFAPQLRYKMARIDLLFGFTYQRRYELACTGASTAGCWIPRPWTSSWAGCRSRGGTASACR
jgi:hypothetical protein